MRFLIHSGEAGGPFAWEIKKKIIADGKRHRGKSLKVFCWIFFFLTWKQKEDTSEQPVLEAGMGTLWSHCCRLAWRGMLDVIFTTCCRSAPDTKLFLGCFLASFYSDWKSHANPNKLSKNVPVKNWWFSIKNYPIGKFPLTSLEIIIPFPHNLYYY